LFTVVVVVELLLEEPPPPPPPVAGAAALVPALAVVDAVEVVSVMGGIALVTALLIALTPLMP
jgi:hypothetical protein